jgi:[acyl-carrier-protein] S-malonyltransferase
MESATPVGAGGMSALLGAEIDQAEAVAKQCAEAGGGVCVVANDNAPGQVVISGTKAAIDKAPEIAKALGVKRAMALNVAAPFHSPLMQPAADKMREVLAAATIRPLSCPLVANVTATETSEPETIRRLLVEQVTGRVRWRESVLAFKGYGVTTTVEATAKDTVTAMVKRIDKDLATVLLVSPGDIEAFVKAL